MKSLPTKRILGPGGLVAEIHKKFKEVIAILLKLFHTIDQKCHKQNFYKAAITLVSNLHKDTTKKEN